MNQYHVSSGIMLFKKRWVIQEIWLHGPSLGNSKIVLSGHRSGGGGGGG